MCEVPQSALVRADHPDRAIERRPRPERSLRPRSRCKSSSVMGGQLNRNGTTLIAALCVSSLLLDGCASIQGIPAGIDEKVTGFPTNKGTTQDALTTNIEVARQLWKKYQRARDDNLHYAFWSNA